MSKDTQWMLHHQITVDGRSHDFLIAIVRKGPGDVHVISKLDGAYIADIPLDNMVKASTTLDPEHASGAERQIADLRNQIAKVLDEKYDWQARVAQLEAELAKYAPRLP